MTKQEAKSMAYGLVKMEIESAMTREWPWEEGVTTDPSPEDQARVVAALEDICDELLGLEEGTKRVVNRGE